MGRRVFAAAGNVPGARFGSSGWIDSGGNLWLFGGAFFGYGGDLNDLWKFNPGTKQWTWVSGSPPSFSLPYGGTGVYGTLGVASASNTPGARGGSATWVDGSGNLWLFGGDNPGSLIGQFSDLWKFNPTTSQWTWMGGSNSNNTNGTYGTMGTPSSSNVPGARSSAASWTDVSGNFWLFGGNGYDSTKNGTPGILNDLWEFNPANNTWVWVSGSSTKGAAGVYGTMGTASSSNTPGERGVAQAWTDKSGNFWLFGGDMGTGVFNDLWRFNPTAMTWTWVGGASTINSTGSFGTKGTVNATNVPSARAASAGWIDASGNLWLFGGSGSDSAGTLGVLSDLWRYQP